MNGIGNISLFTMLQRAGSQYFNANVSRSFNLSQVISSNQGGIGVKVSLSDESIYKNLLTSIQTNTAESIDGMNKKGIKEIWEIVANGKGNAEA
ncbi:hypothetical protein EDI29_07675, partial [Pectobacterium polonicum]